jgi:hypothetical protein
MTAPVERRGEAWARYLHGLPEETDDPGKRAWNAGYQAGLIAGTRWSWGWTAALMALIAALVLTLML